MPVYKGTEFIERIHKGTEQLRRVYKGNELVYGLYDINYHNRENDYTPSNGEITEYAWGLTRDIAPESGNTDFDDYFDEYRSHWYGWYDDADYQEERPQDGDQYIIIPQDCEDLNLYAKWKQKKFSYEGSYTISGGSSTSIGGQALADEAISHIGETGSDRSPYNGENWTTGADWCARFVSICLKQVGHDIGIKNYAPDFFNSIQTGELTGKTFISPAVNAHNNYQFNDWVIEEKDLQPGDILCSYIPNWDNGWLNWNSKTIHSRHVVIVVSVENGKAQVVGGNERSSSVYNSRVNGPHNIAFETWPTYWGVARFDFDNNSTIITDNFTTVDVEEDCEDQDNPEIPEMYITGEGLLPEDDPGSSTATAPLPEPTTWSFDLPDSWYYENGGWFLKGANWPGECVWGANGRTAQMRNNPYTCAPWGNGSSRGRYYDANQWPWDHGGHWSTTIDWKKVQVGDCIIYGNTSGCNADDGSGYIPWTTGNHVVVVEKVLGDGKFEVSQWNDGNYRWINGRRWGRFAYRNPFIEEYGPGDSKSSYGYQGARVSCYLINHEDPVIGVSPASYYSFSSSFEMVTSERVFDYTTETWGKWEEVDRSPDDWNYEWGEE